MSVFGPLLTAGTLERAVVDRLRNWTPTYLAEVERQAEREAGTLPRLRGVIRVSELDRWPQDQLPCAIVVSPGTIGSPVRDAEGVYQVDYSIGVATLVATREEEGSREVAQLYGAAVRGALVQQATVTEGIHVVDWLGESFDDFPVEDRGTMFGSLNLFAVRVDELLSWKKGPPPTWTEDGPTSPTPPENPVTPFDDEPTIETIDIDVERET